MKKRKMKQILKLIAKLQADRDLYKGNMQHETQVLHLSYAENDNLKATISQLQDQISHMNTWIDNLTGNAPITHSFPITSATQEEMDRSATAILSRDTSVSETIEGLIKADFVAENQRLTRENHLAFERVETLELHKKALSEKVDGLIKKLAEYKVGEVATAELEDLDKRTEKLEAEHEFLKVENARLKGAIASALYRSRKEDWGPVIDVLGEALAYPKTWEGGEE